MRALKILVVVMGVMLVGGFIALIISIAYMTKHRQATAPAGRRAAPYIAPPIELPAGARIETMALGADRLVLDIITADGNREVLVLDLASGRRLGTIPLRTAPSRLAKESRHDRGRTDGRPQFRRIHRLSIGAMPWRSVGLLINSNC